MAFLLLSEARGGGEADGSTPGGRATQLTQESEASRPHCPERSGSPKDKGTRKSPKIRNFRYYVALAQSQKPLCMIEF